MHIEHRPAKMEATSRTNCYSPCETRKPTELSKSLHNTQLPAQHCVKFFNQCPFGNLSKLIATTGNTHTNTDVFNLHCIQPTSFCTMQFNTTMSDELV